MDVSANVELLIYKQAFLYICGFFTSKDAVICVLNPMSYKSKVVEKCVWYEFFKK